MNKYTLDVLRGIYLKIPRPVKSLIGPLLSLVPAHQKFGKTYTRFREMLKKSENDANFVRRYQDERLREVLGIAVGQSSYYREIFRNSKFDVGDRSIAIEELISAFPILKKNTIREDVESLLTVPKGQLDEISTSGSSGKPLRFFLDKDRSVKELAFIHHIWSKAGYRADDKRAVLRGVHIANVDDRPWEYDSALHELRLSPFHLTGENIKAFLHEISKRRIAFIHGYPSALTLVAKHIVRDGWPYRTQIRGLFPISESLFSHQRKELKVAFPNALILPFYGLSEKVAIAGEVAGEDDLYEFEPMYGITELVGEDGRPVRKPGEKGHIVSTGLMCVGMPLVRYDTEDEAELIQFPDEMNGYRLRVRHIRSRWSQEFVIGKNEELISIAAINIHSSAYAKVREFQFYQNEKGIVEVRVVPRLGSKMSDLQEFVREIQEKVGSSTKFVLKQVDKVERNPRGKSKFVEQKLDTSYLNRI